MAGNKKRKNQKSQRGGGGSSKRRASSSASSSRRGGGGANSSSNNNGGGDRGNDAIDVLAAARAAAAAAFGAAFTNTWGGIGGGGGGGGVGGAVELHEEHDHDREERDYAESGAESSSRCYNDDSDADDAEDEEEHRRQQEELLLAAAEEEEEEGMDVDVDVDREVADNDAEVGRGVGDEPEEEEEPRELEEEEEDRGEEEGPPAAFLEVDAAAEEEVVAEEVTALAPSSDGEEEEEEAFVPEQARGGKPSSGRRKRRARPHQRSRKDDNDEDYVHKEDAEGKEGDDEDDDDDENFVAGRRGSAGGGSGKKRKRRRIKKKKRKKTTARRRSSGSHHHFSAGDHSPEAASSEAPAYPPPGEEVDSLSHLAADSSPDGVGMEEGSGYYDHGHEGSSPPPPSSSASSSEEEEAGPVGPPLLLEEDPNETYVEETAFLFHDPPEHPNLYEENAPTATLRGLPPAPPLPALPPSGTGGDGGGGGGARWSYDETSRVVLADFVGVETIADADKRLYCEMMQRDDIALVSQGLLQFHNPENWTTEFVVRELQNHVYHKFRRFRRVVEKGEVVEGEEAPASAPIDGAIDGEGGPGETAGAARVSYTELDGFLSMRMSDYFRYLEFREDVIVAEEEGGNGAAAGPTPFEYSNNGGQHTIDDVRNTVLYMIDVELASYLPEMDAEFKEGFRMKEILPGGRWCMMRSLPQTARPLMGPNLYVTPGGGFTHLHQDGQGTVDSGHCVIGGYNEVVMLRRMPERHKQAACGMIPQRRRRAATADAPEAAQNGENTGSEGISAKQYDSLYTFPHGDSDQQGDRPDWPHNDTVKEWESMNYYPCVTILKPGQHIHIGKGRQHMFRKMTLEELPEHDCHAPLRRAMIEAEKLEKAPLCVSIAFDWMFRGFGAEGINREVSNIIECAALSQSRNRQTLAPAEAALLSIASRLSLTHRGSTPLSSIIPNSDPSKRPITSDRDICRGILPSLRHIVERDARAYVHSLMPSVYESVENLESKGEAEDCPEVNVSGKDPLVSFEGTEVPGHSKMLDEDGSSESEGESDDESAVADMDKNPLQCFEDPRGDDYYCRLCRSELPNIYYHCDGCEHLLHKDFNICAKCFTQKGYLISYQMNQATSVRVSTINHCGDMPCAGKDSGSWGCSRCDEKRRGGQSRCTECELCTGCSCDCHTKFTAHFRKMIPNDLVKLLGSIEELAGVEEEPFAYGKATSIRLKVASDRRGAGLAEKAAYLANYPRNKSQRESVYGYSGFIRDSVEKGQRNPSGGVDVACTVEDGSASNANCSDSNLRFHRRSESMSSFGHSGIIEGSIEDERRKSGGMGVHRVSVRSSVRKNCPRRLV